jgi:predicted nucleic acid-binding protein
LDVFLDTGAFAALSDTDDFHHRAAVSIYENLLLRRARLFTSNYILAETYTLIRAKVSHAAAVKFMKAFEKTGTIVLRVETDIEENAKKIFIKYADKAFSFVDCASFALVDKHRLNHAFSFDRHFSQYRFKHPVTILS